MALIGRAAPVRRSWCSSLRGRWPLTKRGDFDQSFLQGLAGATTTVDPCRAFPPSYVFRWGSTRSHHGQGLMQGPNDVEWYERVSGVEPSIAMATIVPEIDVETVRILEFASHNGLPNISADFEEGLVRGL